MGDKQSKPARALRKTASGIKKAYEEVRERTTKVWPEVMKVKHKFDDIYNSNFNPFNLYEKGRDAVQNVINEIPIATVRTAISGAIKAIDAPVQAVREVVDGVIQTGSSALEDADAVMRMTGLGYGEERLDIENGKRLVSRLMSNYGYGFEHARSEATRMLRAGEEQAHKHLARYGNLGLEHLDHLQGLYDSGIHFLKQNPLYEGGQHTFPAHGNTLVGHLRSKLDSAIGSREVFKPYLESRVLDRVSDAARTYIDTTDQRSRMQQLNEAIMYHNPWLTEQLYS